MLKARETGWEGPPFNPIYIADILNIKVEANSSIADARLLYVGDGAKIEFNPQQHRERVRFQSLMNLLICFFLTGTSRFAIAPNPHCRMMTGSLKCSVISPHLSSFYLLEAYPRSQQSHRSKI